MPENRLGFQQIEYLCLAMLRIAKEIRCGLRIKVLLAHDLTELDCLGVEARE
jgi:hypothetical protein